MEIFLTLMVSVTLFLTIELLWRSRYWSSRPEASVDAGTTDEWQLFSLPFVRRRLAALAEELERLDRDPDVFAKAFHTMVARSAYETLSADAARLAEDARHRRGPALDVEYAGPSEGVGEVLEL